MKKVVFSLIVTGMSLTAFSINPKRNDSVQPIAFVKENSLRLSASGLTHIYLAAGFGNYIPDTKIVLARAIKDFRIRFNDAMDIQWFLTDGGYVYCFAKNGYVDRAFYNNKGRWQYSLIFYDEDKLPGEIRTSVKSVYFDWSITLVEEVQTYNGKAFIVHLENKTKIKILKVSEFGETETMDEFIKE
jgi:hypothetical protein